MERTSSQEAIEAQRIATEKTEKVREEQSDTILDQLVAISTWQEEHQKEDNKHFEGIRGILLNVADQKTIEDSVAKAVTITVNGKLDKIKTHLDKQDELSTVILDALAELKKKIRPFDNLRTWAMRLVSGIIYLGMVLAALSGILLFFNQIT